MSPSLHVATLQRGLHFKGFSLKLNAYLSLMILLRTECLFWYELKIHKRKQLWHEIWIIKSSMRQRVTLEGLLEKYLLQVPVLVVIHTWASFRGWLEENRGSNANALYVGPIVSAISHSCVCSCVCVCLSVCICVCVCLHALSGDFCDSARSKTKFIAAVLLFPHHHKETIKVRADD